MLVIAIDGACRRNGKPNCISAGGLFIKDYGIEELTIGTKSVYELNSTNQRGEMLALLAAIEHCLECSADALIVTDSEYLFNTITKDWCANWSRKGWVTAAGTPVKNKDLWLKIDSACKEYVARGLEIVLFHIKGHVMPFGKVTAQRLLSEDITGIKLHEAIKGKYDSMDIDKLRTKDIVDLFEKNNGFIPDSTIFKRFVCANLVADAVANKCVEAADALM